MLPRESTGEHPLRPVIGYLLLLAACIAAAVLGCGSKAPASTPTTACTTPTPENDDPSSVFNDGGPTRPLNSDDVLGEAVTNDFGVGETISMGSMSLR